MLHENKQMKEELMTFKEFIQKYLKASCTQKWYSIQNPTETKKINVAYLAQHPLLDQIPSLQNDIDTNPSLLKSPISYKNIWMGTGDTRTPLHYDSYDNLFVQIAGVKYVRIYDASESSKLYTLTNDASVGVQRNMSELNCELEDYEKHPLAKDAKYVETYMFPGDSLFIPARAWHYVRSLSTSISVNYWW